MRLTSRMRPSPAKSKSGSSLSSVPMSPALLPVLAVLRDEQRGALEHLDLLRLRNHALQLRCQAPGLAVAAVPGKVVPAGEAVGPPDAPARAEKRARLGEDAPVLAPGDAALVQGLVAPHPALEAPRRSAELEPASGKRFPAPGVDVADSLAVVVEDHVEPLPGRQQLGTGAAPGCVVRGSPLVGAGRVLQHPIDAVSRGEEAEPVAPAVAAAAAVEGDVVAASPAADVGPGVVAAVGVDLLHVQPSHRSLLLCMLGLAI